MRHTWIALLLFATLASAGEAKNAYYKARKKRGERQQMFAAEAAANCADSVKGSDYLYLGLLWQFADEWDKAVGAFRAFLAQAKPDSKTRPRAVLEIANSQLGGKKYADVAGTVTEFVSKFPSHAYLNRVRYCEGRAQRALGNLEKALEAFKRGHNAGHKLCPYEVVDCLMQLGRYDEAMTTAKESKTAAGRWKTTIMALPNLGNKLPQIHIDFWVGKELSMGEIKEKPTVWAFWSTKVGNALHTVHRLSNAVTDLHPGNVTVLAPAVYLKFNPIDMKTEEDMGKRQEQSYISGWKDQYMLKYDLIVMDDNVLHDFCGVDPGYPALPAFAITDKKGRLRYVRVGPEDATVEAIDAMLKRLIKE